MRDKGDLKGVIFDIQKFCLHDGPGIRTTVFFKGCNLRCSWCHNPESILMNKQLSFDDEKCALCGECVKVCPQLVHSLSKGKHNVSFNKCKACGLCVENCVPDALKIIGREVAIKEVLAEVEKDRIYYEESGGGITLSGGECTVQYSFCIELLKECRKRHINTCVETNGIIREERLRELTAFVDTFLLDYKLTDDGLHVRYTGSHNAQVINTLRLLESLRAPVVLRCPIIPGVNDTDEHLEEIAVISHKYTNIKNTEIMPYHSMGCGKWKQIGKEYWSPKLETVSGDVLEGWKDIIRRNGGIL